MRQWHIGAARRQFEFLFNIHQLRPRGPKSLLPFSFYSNTCWPYPYSLNLLSLWQESGSYVCAWLNMCIQTLFRKNCLSFREVISLSQTSVRIAFKPDRKAVASHRLPCIKLATRWEQTRGRRTGWGLKRSWCIPWMDALGNPLGVHKLTNSLPPSQTCCKYIF